MLTTVGYKNLNMVEQVPPPPTLKDLFQLRLVTFYSFSSPFG